MMKMTEDENIFKDVLNGDFVIVNKEHSHTVKDSN